MEVDGLPIAFVGGRSTRITLHSALVAPILKYPFINANRNKQVR